MESPPPLHPRFGRRGLLGAAQFLPPPVICCWSRTGVN
jgi:hypothetical protein